MENFINKKSFYFKFGKSNETAIEAGLYIPPCNFNLTNTAGDVVSLGINIKSGDYLLAGIQIKKDASVTLKDFEEIKAKWQKKKVELQNAFQDQIRKRSNLKEALNVKFLLFIINEEMNRKTGKMESWKKTGVDLGENEIIVFFSDRGNNPKLFN